MGLAGGGRKPALAAHAGVAATRADSTHHPQLTRSFPGPHPRPGHPQATIHCISTPPDSRSTAPGRSLAGDAIRRPGARVEAHPLLRRFRLFVCESGAVREAATGPRCRRWGPARPSKTFPAGHGRLLATPSAPGDAPQGVWTRCRPLTMPLTPAGVPQVQQEGDRAQTGRTGR